MSVQGLCMERRKGKKTRHLSGFIVCIKQESIIGMSGTTGSGSCGAESCVVLSNLVW